MALVASAAAEREDAGVALRLTVRNEGDEPVELTFRSGQRAEFVASDDAGEVWRWSDERMFTQQVHTETVAPGESTVAEGHWPTPDPGQYTITATLAATDHRPRATTVADILGDA